MICGILDSDLEYTRRLVDYINGCRNCSYDVVGFTGLPQLSQYARENDISLLVIDETLVEDLKALEIYDKEMILLTRSKDAQGIYKYQSASVIADIISSHKVTDKLHNSKASVMGIASLGDSGRRCATALSLCKSMASESKVLYIGIDEFLPLDKILNIESPGDLSDLMMALTSSDIDGLTCHYGGFDLIIPPRSGNDVEHLQVKDLIELVEHIKGLGIYEKIVLDIGTYVKEWYKLFIYVDEACMVASQGREELIRYEDFLGFLEYKGLINRSRIRKMEALNWTEI